MCHLLNKAKTPLPTGCRNVKRYPENLYGYAVAHCSRFDVVPWQQSELRIGTIFIMGRLLLLHSRCHISILQRPGRMSGGGRDFGTTFAD